MSCKELQSPLAIAIAGLEETKLRLLEAFEWASVPSMVSDHDRQLNGMRIAMARSSLPVIDISLREAFKVLTGHEPPAMGEWPR